MRLIREGHRQVRVFVKWTHYFLNTCLNFVFVPWLRRSLSHASWDDIWQKDIRRWSRIVHKGFGVEIELLNPHGIPLDHQYLLVANHRSWFDQTALTQVMPRGIHFLAKKAYFDLPVFGYGLREFAQGIPVERTKLSADGEMLLDRYVRRGDWVLFYAEGTRGTGRELLPFRWGAFQSSAKTGIPVLPIYIFGSEQILSKANPLTTLQGGKITIILEKPRLFTSERLQDEMTVFEAEYRKNHSAWYDRY